MAIEQHYRIDYLLNGAYKIFYLRAATMNNPEAWHWATVDAGIGQLPNYRAHLVTKLSKPQAEMNGISHVEWSKA